MKRVLIVLASMPIIFSNCTKQNVREERPGTGEVRVVLAPMPSEMTDLRNGKSTYTQVDATNPLKTNFINKDEVGMFVGNTSDMASTPGIGVLSQSNIRFTHSNGSWLQQFDGTDHDLLDFAVNASGSAVESRFMCYYPHTSMAGSPFNEQSSFANFPTAAYTLNADMSTAAKFALNDVLGGATDLTPTTDGSYAKLSLTMEHLNSCLAFNITKSTEWADDDKLELVKVSLDGVYVDGTYDMSKTLKSEICSSVAVKQGATSTRVFKDYATPVALKVKDAGHTGEKAELLVVPFTLDKNKATTTLEVEVKHTMSDGTTESKTYLCELPVSTTDPAKNTFKANVKYSYNVSVNRGSLGVTLEGPDEWGEGPTAEGTVILNPDDPTVTITLPSEITDNNGMLQCASEAKSYTFGIESSKYSLSNFSVSVLPTGKTLQITSNGTSVKNGQTVETGEFQLTNFPSNTSNNDNVPINTYRTVTLNVIHDMTSQGGPTTKEIIKKIQFEQEPVLALQSIVPAGDLPATNPSSDVAIRVKMAQGYNENNFEIAKVADGISVHTTTEAGNILVITLSGFTDNKDGVVKLYPVKATYKGISITFLIHNITQLAK